MHDTIKLPLRSRIPAKSVALPIEHGAWGFLLEPLLAGVLIAPTIGGLCLALLVTGAFLSRQPLKFVVGDWLQKKNLPRTSLAFRWLIYFAAVAGFGLLLSLLTADRRAFIPLLIAAPFVVYLVFQDVSRKSREMFTELIAASVLATSVSTISIAAEYSYAFAAAIWAVMLARLIPSVIYVRNRLRLEKGKAFSTVTTFGIHVAASAAVIALYSVGFSSTLTVVMTLVLLVRSTVGLSENRRKLSAKQIGIREVVYGSVYVLSIVVGFYLKI